MFSYNEKARKDKDEKVYTWNDPQIFGYLYYPPMQAFPENFRWALSLGYKCWT